MVVDVGALADRITVTVICIFDFIWIALRGTSDYKGLAQFTMRQPDSMEDHALENFNIRCFGVRHSMILMCSSSAFLSILSSILTIVWLLRGYDLLRKTIVVVRFVNLSMNSNIGITLSYYFANECSELWYSVELAFAATFVDIVMIYYLVIRGEYVAYLKNREKTDIVQAVESVVTANGEPPSPISPMTTAEPSKDVPPPFEATNKPSASPAATSGASPNTKEGTKSPGTNTS